MRRKVVQHGPSTLTISLPATWVKKHGINKGDEIEVEENSSGLLLSTEKGVQHKPLALDIRGIEHTITYLIASAYKKGVDEIRVLYSSAEELHWVHTVLNRGCVGYEIIQENKSEIIIKQITEPTYEEFKTLFRRLLYFLLSVAQETCDNLQVQDKDVAEKLVLRDWNINKLSDLCRRIVNKYGQKSFSSDTATYHLIEQLEKVGDNFADINKLIAQGTMPGQQTIKQLEKTNALLKKVEELLFKFDFQNFEEFVVLAKKIVNQKLKNEEDLEIQAIIKHTAMKIYDLKGCILMINLN